MDGAVAQLVEQWTENPCVAGSTPAHTTALKTLSVMMGFFVFRLSPRCGIPTGREMD